MEPCGFLCSKGYVAGLVFRVKCGVMMLNNLYKNNFYPLAQQREAGDSEAENRNIERREKKTERK